MGGKEDRCLKITLWGKRREYFFPLEEHSIYLGKKTDESFFFEKRKIPRKENSRGAIHKLKKFFPEQHFHCVR